MIVVNGVTYNNDNNNIVISGNRVMIGGKEIPPTDLKEINITVESDNANIKTDRGNVVTKGNVNTISTVSGDVLVNGDVNSTVSTVSGDVRSLSINGPISTVSGNIRNNLNFNNAYIFYRLIIDLIVDVNSLSIPYDTELRVLQNIYQGFLETSSVKGISYEDMVEYINSNEESLLETLKKVSE